MLLRASNFNNSAQTKSLNCRVDPGSLCRLVWRQCHEQEILRATSGREARRNPVHSDRFLLSLPLTGGRVRKQFKLFTRFDYLFIQFCKQIQ